MMSSVQNQPTVNQSNEIEFPELVKDIPFLATNIIIDQMNLNQSPSWMHFASVLWPSYSVVTIELFKDKGRMKAVLEEWGSKGGTTAELFQILNKLPRKDVIISLEENYPFVRYYIYISRIFVTFFEGGI
jgi:hypothetical protein